MFCDIVVDLKNNQVNKTFEYIVPSWLENIIEVGQRVIVPFGKRKLLGFVIKCKVISEFDPLKLKEIVDVLDITPVLNEELIGLASFMVKNYFSFYISALETMIPTALKVKYTKKVVLKDKEGITQDLLNLFNQNSEFILLEEHKKYFKEIKELLKENKIEIIDIVKNKSQAKTMKMVSLVDENVIIKSKKAMDLIAYLKEIDEDISKKDLIDDMGYSASVIKTLEEKKAITIYDREIYREIGMNKDYDTKVVTLNEEQKEVYRILKNDLNEENTYLLHGVTGSGKTEIYLNLINDCINSGKQAIMLVPEISLTVQTISRFKGWFGDKVAVLHSRLNIGEKYDEWRRILRGEASVVVGARSAIFAPFKNIGIIIIDEEHEGSYVQEVNPKYKAIDIARERSKYHKSLLLLGSATPKVETYYNTQIGKYKLLELTKRANEKAMPKVDVLDMREEFKNGNMSVFSSKLLEKIKEKFSKNEQIILFLNRRGFSTFVMCRECGKVITCPNCDVSLTYHKMSNKLKCHYCGHEESNTTDCPNCGSKYIRFVGGGTQKVEEELRNLIPEIRILRVDSDTTTGKYSHEILFNKFKNHEADVLIGTQIVAKGLDFPDVTLVGVLNADLGLKLPDYDTFEIGYNILEQVSGRAGRGELEGDVIIQTYDPSHFSIVCASKHEYKTFYNEELRLRKMLSNPPFFSRVEIMISSEDIKMAKNESKEIVKMINNMSKNVKVYGPSEALIFKVNNEYRYVITLKFIDDKDAETLIQINEHYQNIKDIKISITRM